jgi:hypothetical protein
MTISELLSNETKWTKFADARNSYGKGVSPTSSEAVKWCLQGAAIKCGHFNNLSDWFLTNYPSASHISGFNDKSTFQTVMQRVQEYERSNKQQQ